MSSIRLSPNSALNKNLHDLLNNVLKDIMSALGAECGSLFLFDTDSKELVLDSFYNSKNLDINGHKRKLGEGIAGRVVDIKVPVLVKNIDSDSRFTKNGFGHYRTKSFIAIPLIISNGLLGLINIADKTSGEPFTEQDLARAVAMSKYACMAIDIFNRYAELQKDKEEFVHQKALLEKYANVGKLAANLVHEINNPLDGVIRYNNMAIYLLEQADPKSVTKEYLTEVKKGLSRIANITKSLIDFSQLVNSKHSDIKEIAEVNTLLDDALLSLKDKIHPGITVTKHYARNKFQVRDIGLSRVFVNIIKNAVEAMPEKGTLDISTSLNDSNLEICFKDSGPGIPSDIQHSIFEPFFTTKGKEQGMGLGLAICKEIVDRYDGKINVASCFGRGSEFRIEIPKKYLENA